MSLKKIVLLLLVSAAVLIVAGPYFVYKRLNRPVPVGLAGEEADALARTLQQAVRTDAWAQVGAISWTFMNQHHHLWDRQRQLHRMRWEHDDTTYTALLDVQNARDVSTDSQISGRIYVKDVEVHGADAARILHEAVAMWRADTYWLNPFEHFFDADVQRSIVTLKPDDADVDQNTKLQALLITHTRGGLMNGGRYLWFVDKHTHIPYGWHMWVPALSRIGGMWTTWEDWRNIPDPNSPKIATLHRNFLYDLVISELRTATSLRALLVAQAAEQSKAHTKSKSARHTLSSPAAPSVDPFLPIIEQRK